MSRSSPERTAGKVRPGTGSLAGIVLLALWTLPLPAAGGGQVWLPGVAGVSNVSVRTVQDKKFDSVVRQEYDFSCGSAALATLLTYHYDEATTEQQTFRYMYERGDQSRISKLGFSLLDMKRYLEDHGYQADGYEASLDTLAEAGIAAITLINYRGYQHFVVVKGLEQDRVLVGDPALGMRSFSRREFEDMWPTRILFIVRNHSETGRRFFNGEREWRALVRAPLGTAVSRDSLASLSIALPGYAEF